MQNLALSFKRGKARFEGKPVKSQVELQNIFNKLMEKKADKQKIIPQLELLMGQIRLLHNINKISIQDVYNEVDPIFPNTLPEDREFVDDANVPLEVRKLLNMQQFEMQDPSYPVFDEESGSLLADYEDYVAKYFRQKLKFWYNYQMEQMQVTSKNLEQQYQAASETDPMIKIRANFMFSFLDYENDRVPLREKFISEMNKKTTLEDIGKMLDEFVYKEKGELLAYFDPTKPESKIRSASKDVTNLDLHWSGRIFQ